MVSKKAEILSYLFRAELSDQPTAFGTVLAAAAESGLGMNRIDAEGFAAANTNRYWPTVLEQCQADERLGLVPFCEIVHRDSRLIRNPCVRFSGGDNKSARTGAQLRARPAILSSIDQLTAREYEALGCFASRLMGADRNHLTPSGNEGGIDFLAAVRFFSSCHVFTGLGREVRIVAQSKKYATKVEVGAVDAFITTLENVRKRSARVDGVIPPWFHASTGPIVGWIVSHSGFQAGAQNEAKKHGIILSDSRDIAEIITLSNRYHAGKKAADRAAQLGADVKSILDEFPEKSGVVQSAETAVSASCVTIPMPIST